MEAVIKTVWSKSKVLIKGFIIFVIFLLLQIPTMYVKSLVEEREARQKEAIAEVSSKWAGKQIVAGPVLVLPYADGPTRHFATFLPDNLSVNANVEPQEKYRGIYKVILFNSSIQLGGTFGEINLAKLNIRPETVLWNEAFLRIYVADVKGLNDEIKINLNDQSPVFSPYESGEGLSAPLYLKSAEDAHNLQFNSSFNLNGAEQLLFTPVGRNTSLSMNSKWPHPSFAGTILPQQSQVLNSGFTAKWKSLSHNRNFPQQWKDDDYRIENVNKGAVMNLNASAFGTELFIPVNSYLKTMRSVKYAALCIILTFATFFLIETNNKTSVHPFHYGLIGLALIIFYTLLLSLSEYIGFNPSYLIASLSTIGLIAWFVSGLLESGKFSLLLSALLVLMYTYIFTILQLQDYSLLLGSIGLFVTLGVIMHFSKRIKW